MHSNIEDLAKAAVLVDPQDLPGLVALQESFTKLACELDKPDAMGGADRDAITLHHELAQDRHDHRIWQRTEEEHRERDEGFGANHLLSNVTDCPL